MVMDTRLPLMAKAPDPLGSYSRGISAADLFNRTKREQGKQNFLKQYGEALFAGDQSALSAYAAHDLQGAKQIQAQQQAEAARRAAAGRAAGRARAQEAQGRLQGGLDASSVIYGQAMDLPEGERAEFFTNKMTDVVGPDFLEQTGITVDTFPSRAAMFSAEQGLKYSPYEAPAQPTDMDLAKLEGQLLSNEEKRKSLATEGGGADGSFTTPQVALDQNNELVYFQTNAEGVARVVEDMTPVGAVKTINTGTEIITINSKTGEEISRRAVNNEEAARAKELGTLSAKVELAGEVKSVEKNAEIAAKIVEKNLETSGLINTSVGNIQTAIDAIDEGGLTGLGYNMLPDITEASAKLSNALSSMGLDVVGGTTFGALSEGELKLAMSVAAPRDLAAPELRSWLIEKQAAQRKLAAEMVDAAKFLADPKNTLGEWLEKNTAVFSRNDFETMSKDDMNKITTVDIGNMTADQVDAYLAAVDRLGLQ